MYTYEISNNKAIIYKDGVEFNIVGPWGPEHPNGASIWAEAFCEEQNNPPISTEPTPISEPTEE